MFLEHIRVIPKRVLHWTEELLTVILHYSLIFHSITVLTIFDQVNAAW